MTPGKISLGFLLALSIVVLASFVAPTTKKVKNPDGFAFVPMGSTTVDSNTVSIQAFFMSKNEVTNKQYRTFLTELKAAGKIDQFKQYYPDTTKWDIGGASYNQPMVENYFSHPAYDNYPVVNISYEGAQAYCKWLTQKYEAENGKQKCEFRLPTREEFVYAARGGLTNVDYPWGGPYLRNSKGCFLCNFNGLGPEHITYNSETKRYEINCNAAPSYSADGAFHTIIVGHYAPNDLGLYDLSGNVAEMVQQKGIATGGSWNSSGYDVRVESTMKYDEPSPYVGFRPVMTFLGE